MAAGALAWLLTRAVYLAEDTFHRLPIHWMWWPAIGGVVVGVGGLIEPRVLGVGYDVIDSTLAGKLALATLIAVAVGKLIVWAIALGSNTSGGVLAPLLMIGAAVGGILGHVLPGSGPGTYAVLGMAAALAGVTRSPLTSVVFALELTWDVDLLLPLLVACSLAHLFSVLVLRRSILTEKVARRGYHVSREYSVDPLAGAVRPGRDDDQTCSPSSRGSPSPRSTPICRRVRTTAGNGSTHSSRTAGWSACCLGHGC